MDRQFHCAFSSVLARLWYRQLRQQGLDAVENSHPRRCVFDRWTRHEFRRGLRSLHLGHVRESLWSDSHAGVLVVDSPGSRGRADHCRNDHLLECDGEPWPTLPRCPDRT